MRKLLIKHFALQHITKIFGIRFFVARATTPLAAIFLVIVLLEKTLGLSETIVSIAFLVWLTVAYIIGFVYFRLKPVTYKELGSEQKWIFGRAAPFLLGFDEEADWQRIDLDMNKQLERNNRKVLPAVLPLILLILTLMTYIKWNFLSYTFS